MHLLTCFYLILIQQSLAAVKFSECANDYLCYTFDDRTDPSYKVMQANGNVELKEDNFVIVKIHAYSEKRYKVVMQSLKKEITSIEFLRNNVPLFSCTKSSTGAVFKTGKYSRNLEKSAGPLKCEDDFRLINKVIDSLDGEFQLRAKTPSNQQYFANGLTIKAASFFYCDPSQLKFKVDKTDKTKAYSKVVLDMSKVSCYDKKYTYLEYRKNDTSDYVKLDKGIGGLSCVLHRNTQSGSDERKFELKLPGGPQYEDTDIDVRCVGEAKFFCDYVPRHPEGKHPLEKSHSVTEGTKLVCTHKFFVIKGKATRVTEEEPKFVCTNFKRNMYWTYNNIALQPKGTEVYCTAEIDCTRIENKFLHGSFLNNNNIPDCYGGGKLQVNEGTGEKLKNVKNITCDRKQGKIYYVEEKGKRDVVIEWNQTKLHAYCHYEDMSSTKTAENIQTIVTTVVSVGVGSFVVIGVILGCCVYIRIRRKWKEQAQRAKKDRNESERYQTFENLVQEESSGAEKRAKLPPGTSSKSKFDSPSSGVSTKRRAKGFFAPENGSFVELEPPGYTKEEILEAYRKNDKIRMRNEKFPEGYKMEIREDVKLEMERIMWINAPKINPLRARIRANKVRRMAEQARRDQGSTPDQKKKEDKKKEEKSPIEKKKN